MNADGQINSNLLGKNLFAYCNNNPVNYSDPEGNDAYADAAIYWDTGFWWLMSADGPLPFGDAIYVGGVIVTGLIFLGGLLFAKSSKQTGKEKASDKPSWVNKDMVDPNLPAEENARRILNNKYGKGNWKTGPGQEFNQIKKWLTRSLKLKSIVPDNYDDMVILDTGELLIFDPAGKGFGWLDGVWHDSMF